MGSAPEEGTGAASIGDELVRTLLARQCPQFADLELGRIYHHHEHTAVRLGEKHGMLLPNFAWQAEIFERSPALLEAQARRWRFPASLPVFAGEPSDDFPYPWHVVTWHEFASCANVPLSDDGSDGLIAALAQVHTPAPSSAPRGANTGTPLRELVDEFEGLVDKVATLRGPDGERVDTKAVTAVFRATVDAPIDGPATWTHNNLSPLSVLSDRGQFAGICDWTAFAAGDPAADLGAATLLLERPALERVPTVYGGKSSAIHERARGYRLLYMLRFIVTGNPFLTRYGWERLADIDAPAAASRGRGR